MKSTFSFTLFLFFHLFFLVGSTTHQHKYEQKLHNRNSSHKSTPTSISSFEGVTHPYDLPVLPNDLDSISNTLLTDTRGKKIPTHLWIAFREVPPFQNLTSHLQRLITRQEGKYNWTVHLHSNEDQLQFMRKHFHNTSTLWSFEIIHPRLGNAAADIWRYALLYVFGGVYMDDDSYIEANFDDLIRPNDTLIVAKEKNAYQDDCFIDSYPLSYNALIKKYNSTNKVKDFNEGRNLVSWAIFAAPRHPIILRTLENIVNLIKHEYLRDSVLKMQRYDVRWKFVMCTTGPVVLTASARQVYLEHPNITLRVEKRDFANYGGKFKMIFGVDDQHYMYTMGKFHINLLRSYAPLSLHELEGRLVTKNMKEFFVVKNGTLVGFKDWDHFKASGFNIKHAHVIEK